MSHSFVHLRTHSEYSVVDGLCRIKPLVGAAKDAQMPAVAVTDHVNLFALVKFYKAATAAGIKPICGADVMVVDDDDLESSFTITLLVQDALGYRNLMELISRGYEQGQNFVLDKVLVKKSWVAEKSAGLIALSGAKKGDIGRALLAENGRAESLLAYWMNCFEDRFYLELQRTGRSGENELIERSVQLAATAGCPVVATNDVMFIKASDFDAHEARVCINQSRVLDDPKRPRDYSEQQCFRTSEEMCELFSDIPSAIENTIHIAKRCNIELDLGTYYLPKYPIPDGMTMDEFFTDVSEKGLEERLEVILDKEDPDYELKRKPYFDRLAFELEIIIQMGFPGYFLIVMDFIKWGKDNDIPVGPGRGSGAGSLVAYAQKITDLDPLEYDLLFERFLNPERVSMPDFDIDFCMDNRDKVIDYVARTYGRDAVSQIVTFGTMAAKAVVRDVARVQGKPFGLADKLSKLIPFEVGITLSKALEIEPAMAEFVKGSEEAQEIMDMALKLEGTVRGTGKHAGGVVIAPTKLTDFAATLCDAEGNGLVTQFDKNDVEEAGLVKFDFLGLRTLTIIDWALKTINAKRGETGEEILDITQINLEDPATFTLLKAAQTTAVFQLESSGMKDLVAKLLPSRFEDIIALVALFRPGPLQSGMVDDFINRKHGRAEMAWPHADYQLDMLQPVLEPTYGIILYQEQIMQIAQVMAGFSLGGADMLRRAMGKKKPEEMAKMRGAFLDGCAERDIERGLAGNIFDLVEKFAGYGFNKSHSAAYALVSYQTAWLKTHHPAAFMAAVMSADMQTTEKVVVFVEECRKMGIPPALPSVQNGDYKFTVDDTGTIIYGLGAIKGVGEGPIEAIIAARNDGSGKFVDMYEFCERVGAKKLNKRVLDGLIRCGAMDELGPSRAVMVASIGDALRAADQSAHNQNAGMFDLFGNDDQEMARDPFEENLNVRNWSDKERLNGELDTLGLYLTGHPIDEYETELKNFISKKISEVTPARGSIQKIAGLIVEQRVMKTKKGDNLCFVTLDDRSARIEVTLFGDVYEKYRDIIKKDTVVIMEGEISNDDYSGGIKVRANRLISIPQARAQYAQSIKVLCQSTDFKGRKLTQVSKLLAEYKNPEGLSVALDYQMNEARGLISLGEQWRVDASDDLLIALGELFSEGSVKVTYL
ncbi:MAG: DNA polymerase III subunit alpha [Oceanospirillaceae bacterium]|nr:DNA polymerase III subunit alpha [Oceanospirillaceae bacterium]